jgi:threonine synthase
VAATLRPFVEPAPLADELQSISEAAYAEFAHSEAPIVEVGADHYLLELVWGPTLSFKDYALAVVAGLFDHELGRQGRRLSILGATSGDTGAAAMSACQGRDNLDVTILYPEGRISEIQRRQMTTLSAANVRAVAVAGTFDDCQALVKRALVDPSFHLGAINSINWARIAAQISYYLWTINRLGNEVEFAVPTGNFGNVFAGYAATRMGAPIGGLIVANNRNHGLVDLIEHGRMQADHVHGTLAPAMDIQIPSNLERYLCDLAGGDADRVKAWQEQLKTEGELQLSATEHAALRRLFRAGWIDDEEIVSVIRRIAATTGRVLDPHTAIAWEVGKRKRTPGRILVTVATAHPAKFAPAVRRAIGVDPEMPPTLRGIEDLPERLTSIGNDYGELVRILSLE